MSLNRDLLGKFVVQQSVKFCDSLTVWPVSGPGPVCVAGQTWLDPRTGDQREAGGTGATVELMFFVSSTQALNQNNYIYI